jgi:hypothetical protein
MSLAAETAAKYPLGWRVGTRLAAFLLTMASFALGRIWAGKADTDWDETVFVSGLWFAFQVICLVIGTAWARTWRGPEKFVISVEWKYRRFRARMRRRWIGNRSKEDYSRAEGTLIVPALIVVTCLLMFFVPHLPIFLLIVGGVIFIILMIAPSYRDAPASPISSLVFSALIGLLIGYIF